MQVSLNGSALVVDDAHIAWKTDIDKHFPATPATNFNTMPQLRGGGTISDPIKVAFKLISPGSGGVRLQGNKRTSEGPMSI